MKAIILAAGRATRMHSLSDKSPKCLLKINGQTILEHQIQNLNACGIKEIVVVVGHFADKIKSSFTNRLRYIHNPKYLETNNLFSLLSAKEELLDGFIYLHSDIIFNYKILESLLDCRKDICLMVELRQCIEEEMRVIIKGELIEKVDKAISIEQASGEFIGMAKFSSKGAALLIEEMEEIIREGNLNAYFSYAISRLAQKGHKIHYCQTKANPWMDIDFQDDLKLAQEEVYPKIKKGS